MKSENRRSQAPDAGTLVCFALAEEAAPFRKRIKNRRDISVLVTGMGQQNARAALDRVLAAALGSRHRQTAGSSPNDTLTSATTVFTCGFAGGLNPALAPGDVLFETTDDVLRKKLRTAGAKPAKFHCSARIAVTAAEKAELRRITSADAVEMESGVIHTLCHERGLVVATVRVISDTTAEDLPLDFNQFTHPDLRLDYWKLAGVLARSPGTIIPLLRLHKKCRRAAERLALVLETALRQS